MEKNNNKLYRSRSNRMIAGVCGGFAAYVGMDAALLRVILVILTVATGLAPVVLIYTACALIIPEEPKAADKTASEDSER